VQDLLHQLDAAFGGLQSTFAVLRETPIEAALQPPGTRQKHLYDFIDSATVTNLKDSLRACIDRYNEARASLERAKDAFDMSLDNLHSSIENVPVDLTTVHIPDYIPNQYCILEGHAKDAAQSFQMLVQHYDLCVTALRHTEGGSDAATEATGDAPQPSGDAVAAPAEPMSEEERREMLTVLHKDAQEVEDVVSEIREHASEMTFLLSQIENHIARLRTEESALNSVLRIMSNISAEVKSHIATARLFHASWLEDTRPTLLEGIDQWEQQREFYERFDLAYAKLLVEVASRRRRHEKAKRKAEEAQKDLDRLHAEDVRAREQFGLSQGDFLPRDIWPGLSQPPRRYEVRAVGSKENNEEGDELTVQSIPQLARNVVERATARVQKTIPI
jgi:autophagy-related protein 17